MCNAPRYYQLLIVKVFHAYINLYRTNFLRSPMNEADTRFWESFNLDNLLETNHHTNKGYQKYVKFQKKAGQTSGLSFLVNTDADEYFCSNHDAFGFRVCTQVKHSVLR